MDPLIGQAASLVSLIDYQEGAVVSKELLKKKTGTLTLFAFDQGQGLSEHTAPYDALVYVFEGSAAISISNKPHQVNAGELILMPAHAPHSLQAEVRFKMLLVMIKS